VTLKTESTGFDMEGCVPMLNVGGADATLTQQMQRGEGVGILRATQMLNTVLVLNMARSRMEELELIHVEVVVVTKEMISRVGILAAITKVLIGYFVEKRSMQEGVGVGRPT
jgi:hypothetical protein